MKHTITDEDVKHIEIRSEEVQELISQVPPWIMRWGITVFLAILVLLLAASYLIKYPDIVAAPFVLTSQDAPKPIIARTDGRLVKLWVKENQAVTRNQTLGYIESTADPVQVERLAGWLDSLAQLPHTPQTVSWDRISQLNLDQLGELQVPFQSFTQAFLDYVSVSSNGFYAHKKVLLQKEIHDLVTLNQNLTLQKNLYVQDLEMAENEWRLQQKLAQEKVIAPIELRREESKVLAKKMPLRQIENTIIGNLSSQTAKQKELLELENNILEKKNTFRQALHTCKSYIESWKTKYMLVASADGRVYFPSFLQEKQNLTAGQEVFFIGTSNGREMGEVRVPQDNLGKIAVGQTVLVKFNSYPFQEFGLVKGQIASISDIPNKEGQFLARIHLPEGLTTNYHKKIVYKTGMTANAEIVTEDLRLLERFFYDLRGIFKP